MELLCPDSGRYVSEDVINLYNFPIYSFQEANREKVRRHREKNKIAKEQNAETNIKSEPELTSEPEIAEQTDSDDVVPKETSKAQTAKR